MTLPTSGYPLHRPIPGGANPTHAHGVRMAIKQRAEVLAGVPLFAGVGKRDLHAIARACTSRRWPEGICVVPEGTQSQVYYVIVEGRATVSRNGRTVAQLGPGDFFGEISLLDPGPRSATVTAASEMIAIELSRQSFVAVAGDNPAILLRMLEALAKRLRETTAKVY